MSPEPMRGEAPAIEDATPDAPAVDAPPPRANRPPLRRRVAKVQMPADAAARQGKIAMLSWDVLGDSDAVRTFLNTHDEDLGGRPIDLAIEGAAGLAKVEAALARHAAAGPRGAPEAASGTAPDQ